MTINISGQIFSLKPQQINKYAPQALKLYISKSSQQYSFSSLQPLSKLKQLSKQQKIIVSKIFRNLNILCKLNKKQLKQLFKQSKQYLAYQQILGELFFDNKINNYILINKQQSNVQINTNLLRKHTVSNNRSQSLTQKYYKPAKCISVDYRLEFTISNINKKKVMKPVILIIYNLQNNQQIQIYYSIEQFSNLRYQVAQSMKKIYGIQLRTLF